MLKKILKTIMLSILLNMLIGCASTGFSHNYLMRGQVISLSPDNIIVCVGTADGAEVGQILTAYRFYETNLSIEDDQQFDRKDTGKVKIKKIINEHYAKVIVIQGDIKKHDMVQLNN